MHKQKLIIVCGPTASGKTDAAVSLCHAVDGEVVSADSMQIYRGMDIGTAKPTIEERQGIAHHLMDIADPAEHFTVAAYRARAHEAIDGIKVRGRTPVVCGGTGLYIDAITKPMGFSAQSDPKIRAALTAIAEKENGKEELHAMLQRIDPPSAKRLHVNDVRRVLRAIEIYELTGLTMTEQLRRDAQRADAIDAVLYALNWPRETLYTRIDARVDRMIENGLINEVEVLLKNGLSRESTAMQALGYKEIAAMLWGETTSAEAIDCLKQRTRNYAKRQLTWFRRDPRTVWIEAEGKSAGDISREILEAYGRKNDDPTAN